MIAVIVCIPWPDARGPSFGRSIWITFRDLNKTTAASIGHFQTFQADLNTPGSGEYVIPLAVQDALTILRGRGRAVRRYQLSASIAADDWTLQQMIASVWPRKLEKRATAWIVLSSDPAMPGCTLIDKHRDVSLVYCPQTIQRG